MILPRDASSPLPRFVSHFLALFGCPIGRAFRAVPRAFSCYEDINNTGSEGESNSRRLSERGGRERGRERDNEREREVEGRETEEKGEREEETQREREGWGEEKSCSDLLCKRTRNNYALAYTATNAIVSLDWAAAGDAERAQMTSVSETERGREGEKMR